MDKAFSRPPTGVAVFYRVDNKLFSAVLAQTSHAGEVMAKLGIKTGSSVPSIAGEMAERLSSEFSYTGAPLTYVPVGSFDTTRYENDANDPESFADDYNLAQKNYHIGNYNPETKKFEIIEIDREGTMHHREVPLN